MLVSLWLPILVAAVAVFLLSSIIHMALPLHRGDNRKLLDEDKIMAALRTFKIPPGDYMFPCPSSMKDMSSPEMQRKLALGPVGWTTILATPGLSIGKALGQWFLFCIVVGVFVAYIAGLTLSKGADGMLVFRVTSATAVLGYAFSNVTVSMWKGVSWATTWKFVFDGLVYGLATGLVFRWFWPAA